VWVSVNYNSKEDVSMNDWLSRLIGRERLGQTLDWLIDRMCWMIRVDSRLEESREWVDVEIEDFSTDNNSVA